MSKITQYPNLPAPQDGDDLVIVDNSGSPTTKKTTRSEFLTGNPIAGATISGSTVESTTISGSTVVAPGSNIARQPGEITFTAARTVPSGWLICDGSAVSRTTYGNLFSAIVPNVGTFTVTIASPAVVTLNSHNFQTGDQVYLITSGALPTGLSVNILYYVVRIDANTFNLATSRANAYAGTKINTSGSQSGTHNLFDCAYGLGDGTSTFNVPDGRGRVLAGADAMGGTAANRLTLAQSQGVYGNRGAGGGEQGHQLITAELASHSHRVNQQIGSGAGSTWPAGGATSSTGTQFSSDAVANSGSDTSHNNVQPTLLGNYIIKT